MANIHFIDRFSGEFYKANQAGTNIASFDVSSRAKYPFHTLSPSTYNSQIKIPVIGLEGEIAHSVEGIWEGLAIIHGSIAKECFQQKPKKRRDYIEGYRYGNEVLGQQEGREKIYYPSYTFYLDNFASKDAIDEILKEQRSGKRVFLYDTRSNDDLQSPSPLAHSSLLALYLNLKIFNTKLYPKNGAEEILFRILDGDSSIEEKLNKIMSRIDNPKMMKAFQFRCEEHPQNSDDFHLAQKVRELCCK